VDDYPRGGSPFTTQMVFDLTNGKIHISTLMGEYVKLRNKLLYKISAH